jgi:hypothetical protein
MSCLIPKFHRQNNENILGVIPNDSMRWETLRSSLNIVPIPVSSIDFLSTALKACSAHYMFCGQNGHRLYATCTEGQTGLISTFEARAVQFPPHTTRVVSVPKL